MKAEDSQIKISENEIKRGTRNILSQMIIRIVGWIVALIADPIVALIASLFGEDHKLKKKEKELLGKTVILTLVSVLLFIAGDVILRFVLNSSKDGWSSVFQGAGSLLQGTLGVAVAFAGALIVIKIANESKNATKKATAILSEQHSLNLENKCREQTRLILEPFRALRTNSEKLIMLILGVHNRCLEIHESLPIDSQLVQAKITYCESRDELKMLIKNFLKKHNLETIFKENNISRDDALRIVEEYSFPIEINRKEDSKLVLTKTINRLCNENRFAQIEDFFHYEISTLTPEDNTELLNDLKNINAAIETLDNNFKKLNTEIEIIITKNDSEHLWRTDGKTPLSKILTQLSEALARQSSLIEDVLYNTSSASFLFASPGEKFKAIDDPIEILLSLPRSFYIASYNRHAIATPLMRYISGVELYGIPVFDETEEELEDSDVLDEYGDPKIMPVTDTFQRNNLRCFWALGECIEPYKGKGLYRLLFLLMNLNQNKEDVKKHIISLLNLIGHQSETDRFLKSPIVASALDSNRFSKYFTTVLADVEFFAF